PRNPRRQPCPGAGLTLRDGATDRAVRESAQAVAIDVNRVRRSARDAARTTKSPRASRSGAFRSPGRSRAETVGFEPTEEVAPLTALAGPRTRPDYATSPGRLRLPGPSSAGQRSP